MRPDAARIVGFCRRRGLAWEALRRASALVEPAWLERFLDALPPRASGPRVLDPGCGGRTVRLARGRALARPASLPHLSAMHGMALPEPASAQDRLRQGLTVAAAIAQAVVPSLPSLLGWGVQIGTRANAEGPPLISPAGYAFSIWGPIFVWCLAHAVWQAMPAQATDPLARRAGWWFATAMGGDALWAAVFQAGGPAWLTAIILAVIAASAVTALSRLAATPVAPRRAQVWLFAAPLGLLAGWVSVAAFVNLAAALNMAGIAAMRDPASPLPPALVAAATVAALAVIVRTRPFPTYALAVVWALVAVVVRNGLDPTGVTAAVAALLVAALAVRSVRAAA